VRGVGQVALIIVARGRVATRPPNGRNNSSLTRKPRSDPPVSSARRRLRILAWGLSDSPAVTCPLWVIRRPTDREGERTHSCFRINRGRRSDGVVNRYRAAA